LIVIGGSGGFRLSLKLGVVGMNLFSVISVVGCGWFLLRPSEYVIMVFCENLSSIVFLDGIFVFVVSLLS